MKARLRPLTHYRFGSYIFHGPELSKPVIKACQTIAAGVRAKTIGHEILFQIAKDLGHEVSAR